MMRQKQVELYGGKYDVKLINSHLGSKRQDKYTVFSVTFSCETNLNSILSIQTESLSNK